MTDEELYDHYYQEKLSHLRHTPSIGKTMVKAWISSLNAQDRSDYSNSQRVTAQAIIDAYKQRLAEFQTLELLDH